MRTQAERRAPSVAVRSHPPERRRRPSTVAACCCCCCCCCLHSLGGLVGPAFVSRSKTLEEQKGAAAYWWCLLALVAITLLGCLTQGDRGAMGMLIVLLLLPGYQLAAALIAAVVGRFLWGPDAMRRVGRLALRGFVGGLIGLGIMAVPAFASSGSGVGAALSALGLCAVVWLCIVVRRRRQRA